jgi:hypothetical protein
MLSAYIIEEIKRQEAEKDNDRCIPLQIEAPNFIDIFDEEVEKKYEKSQKIIIL